MIVFVLELTNGKYFIGHTYKSEFIMNEFQSDKLYWTRKYKPIDIIEQAKHASLESYIEIINNYMEIYGVKNVYSSIELNIDYCNEFVIFDDPSIDYENIEDERKSEIIRYIKRQHDCSCVLCGKVDHIVSECNIYAADANTKNEEDSKEEEQQEYGYVSIELDENKTNEIIHDDSIEYDMDYINYIQEFNTNDINKIKEQRDYFYNLSYYWYYQMSYLYQYYQQYIHSLYNNQYNYVQM